MQTKTYGINRMPMGLWDKISGHVIILKESVIFNISNSRIKNLE